MKFLVDTNNKIIFGWSAKCGCSHIKTIYWFLQTNNIENPIHTDKDINDLPNDIENYVTLIICRNPYMRIVSGFLDKYAPGGEYRRLYNKSPISFSKFVNDVVKKKWELVERHHFTPQTTEYFDKKILFSKIIKFYDISDIDYEYIGQLYNKKIPECVINKKQGHERIFKMQTADCYDKPVYYLNIDDYINYKVDIKYFYNKEIKEKVSAFYTGDFTFFSENGLNYKNSAF
jgi:hypothetical protein